MQVHISFLSLYIYIDVLCSQLLYSCIHQMQTQALPGPLPHFREPPIQPPDYHLIFSIHNLATLQEKKEKTKLFII